MLLGSGARCPRLAGSRHRERADALRHRLRRSAAAPRGDLAENNIVPRSSSSDNNSSNDGTGPAAGSSSGGSGGGGSSKNSKSSSSSSSDSSGVTRSRSGGSSAERIDAFSRVGYTGPSIVRLRLRKPVGIVFEQKPEGGPVYVLEVVQGGAAWKTGLVHKGDVLHRCSAVFPRLRKGTQEGASESTGATITQAPDNVEEWENVMFDCEEKEFRSVMLALRSNELSSNPYVTLELRQPGPLVPCVLVSGEGI